MHQNMHFFGQEGFQKSKYFGTVLEGEKDKNSITLIREIHKEFVTMLRLYGL